MSDAKAPWKTVTRQRMGWVLSTHTTEETPAEFMGCCFLQWRVPVWLKPCDLVMTLIAPQQNCFPLVFIAGSSLCPAVFWRSTIEDSMHRRVCFFHSHRLQRSHMDWVLKSPLKVLSLVWPQKKYFKISVSVSVWILWWGDLSKRSFSALLTAHFVESKVWHLGEPITWWRSFVPV